MKIKYRCHFELYDCGAYVHVEVEHYDMSAFTEGFWINEEKQLAAWSIGKYWIPPSRILFIERVEEES